MTTISMKNSCIFQLLSLDGLSSRRADKTITYLSCLGEDHSKTTVISSMKNELINVSLWRTLPQKL